jgi:DNA end-binding protein Ku
MAESLIESLSGDFEPEQYSDNYREALQTLIEAKVEGREVVQPAEPAADSGTVVDLMAALRASVEAAREGRGAAPAETKKSASSRGGTGRSAAKKTPAKKSSSGTAKKAATKSSAKRSSGASAKKTTTKRANARKSA